MSAADLIAMGVETLASDGECCRPFQALADAMSNGVSDAAGLREVVRMLADAADLAVDAHDGGNAGAITLVHMRRFSELMKAAFFEIR